MDQFFIIFLLVVDCMREISSRIYDHDDQQIVESFDLDLSLEESNLNKFTTEYLSRLRQQLSLCRIMLEKANLRGY